MRLLSAAEIATWAVYLDVDGCVVGGAIEVWLRKGAAVPAAEEQVRIMPGARTMAPIVGLWQVAASAPNVGLVGLVRPISATGA